MPANIYRNMFSFWILGHETMLNYSLKKIGQAFRVQLLSNGQFIMICIFVLFEAMARLGTECFELFS